MGAMQPGMPNPALFPENWPLLVIDLKDCFSISNCTQMTLTLPLVNLARIAHQNFHQNAKGLVRQFGFTLSEAQGIMRSCPQCS
ncbi:POK25 protein, partial [Crypturellus soui]|nr:POK25 protein [Crypturellus soui]